MRFRLGAASAAALLLLQVLAAKPALAAPLPGTNCNLFPADNILNADISALPVNSQNAAWKSNMMGHANLHPDLGTVAQGYGFPLNVVNNGHPTVTPTFYYDSESDHVGYPFGPDTLIEGGSDAHALMVNGDTCRLYELFGASWNGGNPTAGSGATWSLGSNAMRTNGWTSADAAGLPITPLLLRFDEVVAGSIKHAIRFTNHCSNAYIWPASHDATTGGGSCPPMGARFRLRANFPVGNYGARTQVVLQAFQHHGLMLADNSNGGDWFFQGTQDNGWNDDTLINELKSIPASEFDAVDESSLQVQADSYQAAVLPGAPTGVYAGAGNASATVTWTPPPGGFFYFGLTTYDAGVQVGSMAVPSDVNSWTVGGLTNGHSYTFTVSATNSYGTGPPSAPSNSVTPNAGGQYSAVDPIRVLDTRTPLGNHQYKLGDGDHMDVQVGGQNGVAAGAAGAVFNVTVTNPTAYSYLTIYPKAAAQPTASNLNFSPGETIANLVQVALGWNGMVTIYNAHGSTDVVFDLNGWTRSTAASGSDGLFNPLSAPHRILDTRNGTGGHLGRLGPNQSLNLQVAGTPGIPAAGVAAVVLNLTASQASAGSYLSVFPSGGSAGNSNLNFAPGRDLANRVIVKAGSGGGVTILNAVGSVDVVVDAAGYFTDGLQPGQTGLLFHPTPPVRLVDTRRPPINSPIGPGASVTLGSAGQGLVPANAQAVMGNFTVTDGSAASYLTVWPAGSQQPLASDINFFPNEVVPNLVIVRLSGGSFSSYNRLGWVNLVVDINGYYS